MTHTHKYTYTYTYTHTHTHTHTHIYIYILFWIDLNSKIMKSRNYETLKLLIKILDFEESVCNQ